jgi:hydroxymethylpyrimidine/phosphomethylpyrimidine kinase
MTSRLPSVLCFSGHDPTGGAGIQADIEAMLGLNCRACTIVTALTAQDTQDIQSVMPQRAEDLLAQARLLMNDLRVDAIKIGLLGDAGIARAIVAILQQAPDLPVVLDPVLAAGGGRETAGNELIETLRRELAPLATVITPNSIEARKLAGTDAPLDACGRELLAMGCRYALITGAHENEGDVVNRLYGPNGRLSWSWPRLEGSYHGSGCTLASALAACLAQGMAMEKAVYQAQAFTWRALKAGFRPGKGQYLPDRNPQGKLY